MMPKLPLHVRRAMAHTREDVLAAARAAFPESDLADVLAALDLYGAEPYEREIERVQLAILAISAGNKEELLQLVKAAKSDYRDVLAWQQLGPLSPEDGEKLQAAARALIRNWGKR